VIPAKVATSETDQVDTGFGDIDKAPVHVAPATNTVADTGVPEETDDDLDARVAALMPK
jgi:hypothetical protein